MKKNALQPSMFILGLYLLFFFSGTAVAAESCMLKFGWFSFWKTVINLRVE